VVLGLSYLPIYFDALFDALFTVKRDVMNVQVVVIAVVGLFFSALLLALVLWLIS
jgi:hypothetical protein